jgi:hypothetical protein
MGGRFFLREILEELYQGLIDESSHGYFTLVLVMRA